MTDAAGTGRPAREHALGDGEDFELIVALPPGADAELAGALGQLPLGEFVEAGCFELAGAGGEHSALPRDGWEHSLGAGS